MRCVCGILGVHFYPRPPRGGRPASTIPDTGQSKFLSTPSARRATDRIHRGLNNMAFLSTPSARRATQCGCAWTAAGRISIHALREEGDCAATYTDFADIISIHALREEGD